MESVFFWLISPIKTQTAAHEMPWRGGRASRAQPPTAGLRGSSCRVPRHRGGRCVRGVNTALRTLHRLLWLWPGWARLWVPFRSSGVCSAGGHFQLCTGSGEWGARDSRRGWQQAASGLLMNEPEAPGPQEGRVILWNPWSQVLFLLFPSVGSSSFGHMVTSTPRQVHFLLRKGC